MPLRVVSPLYSVQDISLQPALPGEAHSSTVTLNKASGDRLLKFDAGFLHLTSLCTHLLAYTMGLMTAL